MVNKNKLPEHDFSIDPEAVGSSRRLVNTVVLTSLEEECLEKYVLEFEEERNKLKSTMQESLKTLRGKPLLVAFLVWSRRGLIGKGVSNYSRKLLDQKIIQFTDSKKKLVPIRETSRKEVFNAIEKIRSIKDFDIMEREILTAHYLDFINWLHAIAFFSVSDIEDPDKQKTLHRWLKYDVFIKLLTKLDDRCQLVAKLLYFGGSRVLAEILDLDVRDVDFDRRVIAYDTFEISYPLHVIDDIKNLIGDRKKGKVFLGKNKTSLNAATIFRNFKEAASQVGLNEEFSPKMLSTDV